MWLAVFWGGRFELKIGPKVCFHLIFFEDGKGIWLKSEISAQRNSMVQ